MKVVLFCGGESLRLAEQAEAVPKPMITIGYRPILWHLMRSTPTGATPTSCSAWERRLMSSRTTSSAMTRRSPTTSCSRTAARSLELLNTDIHDWRITFTDSGLRTNVGQRLLAARRYLPREEIPRQLRRRAHRPAAARTGRGFPAAGQSGGLPIGTPPLLISPGVARPRRRGHGITDVHETDLWMNDGFFMFRQEIFDWLAAGNGRRVGANRRLPG